MNNVFAGVLAGIFIGALTVEVLHRRKKSGLTGKLRRMTDYTLDRVAGVFK